MMLRCRGIAAAKAKRCRFHWVIWKVTVFLFHVALAFPATTRFNRPIDLRPGRGFLFSVWHGDRFVRSTGRVVCNARFVDQSHGSDVMDFHHNTTEVDDDYYKTVPRLYVSPKDQQPLKSNAEIDLTEEQAHYVTKVMRMVGNTRKRKKFENHVRLFDGTNGEWLAVLEEQQVQLSPSSRRRSAQVGRSTVKARCTLRLKSQQEESVLLPWIICAPIKMKPFKMLLEKCTELGVGQFIMVDTDYSDTASKRALRKNQLEKLQAQLVQASQQCERLSVPQLTLSMGQIESSKLTDTDDRMLSARELLEQWRKQPPSDAPRTLFVCRERSTGSINIDDNDSVLPVLEGLRQNSGPIAAFLVGPEGGWSPQETQLFDEYSSFAMVRGVSLGPRVLRAETAAMTAMAAWTLYMDPKSG